MILAPKYQTEDQYLRAVVAVDTFEGCHCWPVFYRDAASGRYTFLHLTNCRWSGSHPLTHWMTDN